MIAAPPLRTVLHDPSEHNTSRVALPWSKWFQSITNAVNTPASKNPPAHANSPGTQGQIAFDAAGNLYVCVAPNSWFKYAGSSAF